MFKCAPAKKTKKTDPAAAYNHARAKHPGEYLKKTRRECSKKCSCSSGGEGEGGGVLMCDTIDNA